MERMRTTANLTKLGVYPGQLPIDSGSGNSVYKVTQFPFGPSALKLFDLPSSEKLTLNNVDKYRKTTGEVAHMVSGARDDLSVRHFQDCVFRWTVNNIQKVGLVRLDSNKIVPYTRSPWVDGISLGEIFSYPHNINEEPYDRLKEGGFVGFLREELHRFNRLLKYNYDLNHGNKVNLLPLNVSVRSKGGSAFDLVVTNIREFVNIRQDRLYRR